MQNLKAAFSSVTTWQDEYLWAKGGEFENLMVNYLPTQPGQNYKEGPIHWISAMSLGLLWCEGSIQEKAEILFKTSNPKGENQEKITWNDDELKAVLSTIITFSTIRSLMYYFRDKMNSKTKQYINTPERRKAIAAMVVSDDDNSKGLIFLIFPLDKGNTISREDFIMAVQSTKCSWIFDRSDIRYKMDNQFMDQALLDNVVNQREAEYWKLETEYQPSPRGIRENSMAPLSPKDM